MRRAAAALTRACPLLLAAAASVLSAETQQAPAGPLIRSSTQLVQVTVVVTAHKGHPVSDLTKDDFQLFEQGELKPISAFSFEGETQNTTGQRPLAPVGRISNQPIQQSSTVNIVLLDKMDTPPVSWAHAAKQISSFFATHATTEPLAVYLLDFDSGLQVIEDYGQGTRDLAKRFARWLGPSAAPPFEAEEGPSLSFATRDPTLQAAQLFSLGRIQGVTEALEAITDHVSELPGRKSLIWVAGAFPDPYSSLSTRHGLLVSQYRSRLLTVLNKLIAANVAIYPVDARGLVPDRSFDAGHRDVGIEPNTPGEQSNSIHLTEFWPQLDLASRSGGKAYINTNGFAQSMQEAASARYGSYTLGFYTDRTLDDKYHKLLVHVARAGLTLRYRPGYWAFSENPSEADSVVNDLRKSMDSPFQEQGIRLEATPEFGRNPPTTLRVTLYVSSGRVNPRERPPGQQATFDVICGQKDGSGRTFAVPPYRISAPIPSEASLPSAWLTTKTELKLRPSSKAVRIVVRDAFSGALGSIDIPVPKRGALP